MPGRVVVVMNGAFAHIERLLAVLDTADCVIAADGGANWLADHGRLPDILVGDLDSVHPEILQQAELSGRKVLRYPQHKDETDAELALAAAAATEPGEIILLGALGGRIDHTLGNLSLLNMEALRSLNVRIYDGLSAVWLVSDYTEICGMAGDLVSLIPWGGDAHGVKTEGLAYALRGETLRFGPSRGISNSLTAEHARVSLAGGQLLIVHTPRSALKDEP